MTARHGCHEDTLTLRCLAVVGARPLCGLHLSADQRASFEHALVAECRFLVRLLRRQPIYWRPGIALIYLILCDHIIATSFVCSRYCNPDWVLWTAHPPLLPPVQLAMPSVE